MDGESIRQARLQKLKDKKIIRLNEAFKSYSLVVGHASRMNIRDKQNKRSIHMVFDNDLDAFRKLQQCTITLETLIYFNPPKEENDKAKEEQDLIERYLSNGALYYKVVDRYFPYHIKHPWLRQLSEWDMSKLYVDDWQQYLTNINELKQALYNTKQLKAINNARCSLHKTYHALEQYIKKLYYHYPTLYIAETSIMPWVDMIAEAGFDVKPFNPWELARNENYQKVVSNYTTIRQSYKPFLKALAAYDELGMHLVGYFWKLRHSALMGYFYQIILFFDHIEYAGYQIAASQLPKEINDSLRVTAFRVLKRADLEEIIAGLKLMDSYLKLVSPYDPNTQKKYHDRTFGKGQFKSKPQGASFDTSQQKWYQL